MGWPGVHITLLIINTSRLMSDFESARVRDYSKNIKTLSAKYYYDQDLFKLFCDLVDRDMGRRNTSWHFPFNKLFNLDYPCLCKNKTKNICSKKCRALDFCALADVLDAIAQINFIYINKNYHLKFIRRIAARLCEHSTWETLFKSQGNVSEYSNGCHRLTPI